ncbi:hypothetical protein D9M69_694380 [compost metagenome]
MTLHTGKRGTHQRLPGGIDPVYHGFCSEFFIIGPALIVGHGIAMKGRGNELVFRGVG